MWNPDEELVRMIKKLPKELLDQTEIVCSNQTSEPEQLKILSPYDIFKYMILESKNARELYGIRKEDNKLFIFDMDLYQQAEEQSLEWLNKIVVEFNNENSP